MTTSQAKQVAILADLAGELPKARSGEYAGDSRLRKLQVYPISNYGTIQIGTHRFCEVVSGQEDRAASQSQFLQVWQNKEDVWKITRALSYDP